jgi:formyltetrahydrofolate deformylase
MGKIDDNRAILLIHCSDRKGIIASVTRFLAENQGNILYLDQHVDPVEGEFFMRLEWDLQGFSHPIGDFGKLFSPISEKYGMQWKIYNSGTRPRMAIMVSKLPHCLDDILARYNSAEWSVEIPLVISNHMELEDTVRKAGIEFCFIPKTAGDKPEQEKKELELLERNKVNFIVLARYMQILSPEFVSRFRNRIINIHHSFLPAFPGAKPYHSAYARGVKIIGATSHYVTEDLDEGPIIEQDVARVTHRDSIRDMLRRGRDLEKIVLSRAIHAHLSRKVMVYKNKTVVFS